MKRILSLVGQASNNEKEEALLFLYPNTHSVLVKVRLRRTLGTALLTGLWALSKCMQQTDQEGTDKEGIAVLGTERWPEPFLMQTHMNIWQEGYSEPDTCVTIIRGK